MCVCSLQLHTRLCVCPEAGCACVGGFASVCGYFMTLSASLSGCIQFICVRFYFFSKRTVSLCIRANFSCMSVLFFRGTPFEFGLYLGAVMGGFGLGLGNVFFSFISPI